LTVAVPASIISVGEEVELSIYALAYGGEGIAKYKGLVIFVANALPGDKIWVRILQVKKRFARAELIKIIESSVERIKPICPQAGICGGCSWLPLTYSAQLKAKQSFVEKALHHIGRLKCIPVLAPLKSDPHIGYRHKIQIPLQAGPDGIKAGFYKRQTHQVVSIDECPIQPAIGNRLFKAVKELANIFGYSGYDEENNQGQLRYLVIRIGANTREVLVILVTAVPNLLRAHEFASAIAQQIPEVVGVVQNTNAAVTNVIFSTEFKPLTGRPFLYEEIRGIHYRISAESFFQINPYQLPNLAETVFQAMEISGNETVVDLFCGVGFLSLQLARYVRRVFGIEFVGKAVEDAETNKHLNNISNVEFFTGDAAEQLRMLSAKGLRPDAVVLDPPRKGCAPALLKYLIDLKPRKVVYISCNPITLARDLAILSTEGYRVKQIQPIDLFPHTYHIESVASLVRRDKK